LRRPGTVLKHQARQYGTGQAHRSWPDAGQLELIMVNQSEESGWIPSAFAAVASSWMLSP